MVGYGGMEQELCSLKGLDSAVSPSDELENFKIIKCTVHRESLEKCCNYASHLNPISHKQHRAPPFSSNSLIVHTRALLFSALSLSNLETQLCKTQLPGSVSRLPNRPQVFVSFHSPWCPAQCGMCSRSSSDCLLLWG